MNYPPINTKTRRDFIRLSSMAGLGFLGFQQFVKIPLMAENRSNGSYGYGLLKSDKDRLLNLPEGFSYKVISKKNNPMSDGFFTPGRADGMATFSGKNGKVVLVRNHEVSIGDSKEGAFGINNELLAKIKKEQMYDYGKGKMPAMGGTTTMIFNEKTQAIEKDFLSLAGTARNCAGGVTPWNSWITCEETVDRAGTYEGFAEKDHGYNFEVPATETVKIHDPIPLKEMGRFNHEAVAVDPKTSIVYQTEDASDGLIYRYIPNEREKLQKGGRLQALAIVDQKGCDTRNWKSLSSDKFPIGIALDVEWVDITNVNSPDNDLRYQGFNKGAARFARGEGMWFGDNNFFFACTNGGRNSKGQVFKYTPSAFEGTNEENSAPGKLELFVEPNNTELAKSCDNLTISPWGDIILCEDSEDANLVGITPEGGFYRLGKCLAKSELAGAVFSPSGNTLFVNVQDLGMTLAITGPWKEKTSR